MVSPRLLFASIRLPWAALDGREGRRAGGGGAMASTTSSANRSVAASRLRSCDRRSDATTVTTPSTRRPRRLPNARSRCVSESADDASRSQLSSTRESVVLTPWPPGPDALENRHDSSCSGIVTLRFTTNPDRGTVGPCPSLALIRSACPASRVMGVGGRRASGAERRISRWRTGRRRGSSRWTAAG